VENNMTYTYSRPDTVSFTGKGLLGYTFGPLKQDDMEIYYVEVEKGHDVFMISKKITRTYYVISGSGYFTIDNARYDITPGMVIEVPPGLEYCYSGKMTLLAISKPRWFSGNDRFTRWNPDVLKGGGSLEAEGNSLITRLIRWRIFGKSPVSAFLRVNQRLLWDRLPASVAAWGPVRAYGDLLHVLARRLDVRAQAFATLFLRNRPELELLRRLSARAGGEETLKVAVLGCSTGAEAYSIAWRLRSARPELKLAMHAIDISPQAVEFAECGVYSLSGSQMSDAKIFETVTPAEMEEIFETDGQSATVRQWIRQGLKWGAGDAGDPELVDALGQQDIVVASNFLCHMSPQEAERCLRNIARLVSPGGYLFVTGVDLDVRTKVARDLGWEPVEELLEEIHNGDPYLRRYWPGWYAGLEPINKKRQDWKVRYAIAFRIPPMTELPGSHREDEMGEARQHQEPVLSLSDAQNPVSR
jgi:SAM-dependent methyltransferase/mannose-6-phosphate isomerase-like protein (cupin superfamily)